VPEPNAYLAWIALQNHMRPYAANRKIELLQQFNTIEQKLGVPIAQFNSEFNVLLAELQAYGAMIDEMMAAQKYISAVRVPPQERALLGASLNLGLPGLQAITSNWGMLNSHANSHSSAKPHVKGYSANVDSEDESKPKKKHSKKAADKEVDFSVPKRSLKGSGPHGPQGKPNGNGKT
jgi:hypothetical protein